MTDALIAAALDTFTQAWVWKPAVLLGAGILGLSFGHWVAGRS